MSEDEKLQIINAVDSFLHDVKAGESELDELFNVVGYKELRYLVDCIKALMTVVESSGRIVDGMTEDYERMTADRDYWKMKFLLSQRG